MADIQTSATGGDVAERASIQSRRVSTVTESLPVEDATEQFSADEEEELGDDPLHCKDPVMHISGAGHWFLEGWIGDHSVEFLIDSGSSVTAISDVLYGNLPQAGAPVGALQATARTLRSANGTGIEVLGCSRCSVSFLGLRTEFPIIICSLAAGTDAIIGTDVLGSVLPHTLDIKNGLLFTQGGLGGVLSQIQDDRELVVAYCSRALRPSQRRYCTTKRKMLAVVAMCLQFRSYLRGAHFTLRTDHKSLVWLHRFKDTEGMLSRWLHSLQQFQFSIIHRPGKDHGNADGLSRAPSSPCRQCTRPDCPPATLIFHDSDQPFDSVSTGSSEDADLVLVQSGEDWIARLDDDLSRPVGTSGDSFRISALQREDPVCVTLHDWVLAEEFPAWAEVKSMLPELRSLWHHRNNLSVDDNGTLWRKRSSQSAQLQLLVPKAGREQLFLSYHASLFGGHLGRTRTLARLADRFYWTGMADDVKDWLSQCVACIKRKSPVGRHHPLGHIPTGHRWDRIAMDILDVCDPTPEGFRYILVIADYFSKWTEAFPMKNKCADTVADILVEKIILRFGMPLVIHSDQGREFENGLMKSLCALLGCTKTRTAPYHPESDGMIERFNRTCLMMLSMFVNDRRDNWHELLPFIMHAYRTSVHESTGYSPFRLMMGEECSLPQDVSTAELRTQRENDVAPHAFATWVSGRVGSGV